MDYPHYDAPVSTAPDLVVVDQGSIFTKLRTERETLDFLSVHAPMARGHSLHGASYLDAVRIDQDPTWWAFGSNMTRVADLSRINHISSGARYVGESYRRGMAYSLFRLHSHIQPTKEYFSPIVVASIPASEFKRNKTSIEENLAGKYVVHAACDGKERAFKFNIKLDNLNVLPEGAGTFYDCIQAEEQGVTNTNFANETVAICSWGWYTLSIILFQGGVHVAGIVESNSAVGMSSVADAIYNRLKIEPGASVADIDEHMRGDELIYHGRKLAEFPKIKAEEIRAAGDQGLAWLHSQITRSRLSVDSMVFTGGTSINMWKHIDIENHPLRDVLPYQILKVENAAREDCDGAFNYFNYMMHKGI